MFCTSVANVYDLKRRITIGIANIHIGMLDFLKRIWYTHEWMGFNSTRDMLYLDMVREKKNTCVIAASIIMLMQSCCQFSQGHSQAHETQMEHAYIIKIFLKKYHSIKYNILYLRIIYYNVSYEIHKNFLQYFTRIITLCYALCHRVYFWNCY